MTSSMDIIDIQEFIRAQLHLKPGQVQPQSDLARDLGVDGDDFFELMQAFSTRYGVDLTDYKWYFHHGEEPHLGFLTHWFRKPLNKRVTRIPVTSELLLSAAKAGRWTIVYPPMA